MRLRGLLDRAELGLLLRTGAPVGDRAITSVYTTDLTDPSRFLSGGELVLTGLVWWRHDGDADPFVASLAQAGVSALGAGTIALGGVPDDVVTACATHGVPLIEVPEHVSFAAITEVVVLANASVGTGLTETVAHAATVLGAGCWVLGPTGRVVAGRGAPPLPRRQALVRARPLPPGYSVVFAGEGPAAWRVVVEADLNGLTAAQQSAVAAVVDACSADRSAVHRPPPTCQGSACVVAAGCPAELLDEIVAHVGLGTVHVVEDTAVAVLPATPVTRPALLAALRDAVSVVDDAPLGVTDCVTTVDEAVPEAMAALRLARAYPGPVRVHDVTEPATAANLAGVLPAELRESYVERVLGPVLDYDRRHGGGLVQTVKVFMACSCSWTRAAAQLHIHVNSLRYRIGRIEDLTGRDLSTLPDQADVHLALQLL